MASVRSRWATGALLVAAGWLLTPHPLPIYDGVGLPDEAYRYVVRPPGAPVTKPPTSAAVKSPVVDGSNRDPLDALTGEHGPQAELDIAPTGVTAAGTTVELRLTPQAPSAEPKNATIVGNVYVVSFVDGAGAVTVTKVSPEPIIYLRVPTVKDPGPVMVHRDNASSPWKTLKTFRGGQDFYTAIFVGSGEYAMAYATTTAATGSSGPSTLAFLGLGLVLLLVGVVIVIRRNSRGP